jgi:hypothetical protein
MISDKIRIYDHKWMRTADVNLSFSYVEIGNLIPNLTSKFHKGKFITRFVFSFFLRGSHCFISSSLQEHIAYYHPSHSLNMIYLCNFLQLWRTSLYTMCVVIWFGSYMGYVIKWYLIKSGYMITNEWEQRMWIYRFHMSKSETSYQI